MPCSIKAWVFILPFFSSSAVHSCVLPPGRTAVDTGHLFVFDVLAIFAVASHWRGMTTDQGAVPLDAEPLLDQDSDLGDFEEGAMVRSSICFLQRSWGSFYVLPCLAMPVAEL